MCTVTYIPLGSNLYVLTSNRDERTARPTDALAFYNIKGNTVIYPKDKVAQGSWIATSAKATVCLLNGAFEPHISYPPYKHSRGLVVVDYFKFSGYNDFYQQFAFEGIEPFTLIILESLMVLEIRWDGTSKFITEFVADQPRIWSSVTLYAPDIIQKREEWFREWLRSNREMLRKTPSAVVDFHRFGGEGDDENDLVMKRKYDLQTVSITSIVKNLDYINLSYFDIIENKEHFSTLPLNPSYA